MTRSGWLVDFPMDVQISLFHWSEAHRLGLDHVGQTAHCVDQLRRQRLIDLNESDRVFPRRGAAQVERRDVDLRRAERLAERTDKAGLVIVANKQHVTAEFGLERNALDLDEARLAAGEDGASDGARAPFGGDGDPNEVQVIAGAGALRLADPDAAFGAEQLGIDRVYRGEQRR